MVPNLYEYSDYRKFLKDYLQVKQNKNPLFSKRKFSLQIGFASEGHLYFILSGKRNLSQKTLQKVLNALKLNKREEAYFENLVYYTQATNDKEREKFFLEMSSLRPVVKSKLISDDEYNFLRSRFMVVIREMIALPHFKEDPEWIASVLEPPSQKTEIETALKGLLHLGLIKKKKGKFVQSDATLTTPPEALHAATLYWHAMWLGMAREALYRFKKEERDFSGVTLPIPRDLIPKIKKMISDFRESLLELAVRAGPGYDDVFQMNIQLFPVTDSKSK